MSEAWKHWEGQVVDAKFPLRRYLGGSDHSAVFLTERGDPPQKSAIKFIQVDEPDAELQLSHWKRAATLSHPHVLRIFESGRCRLGDFDLLYVLMEYAEENLAQFLPQRPLTPAEARDVLTPTLQALGFLHAESLVHGRVKPSNILAIEDQLKLSSDAIFSVAEHPEQPQLPSAETQSAATAASLRHLTPYHPPEAAKGIISPAGDIWALGVTLVEALTQRLPAKDAAAPQDPLVPETLPAVFLDIARHCLHRDPQKRWTVVEIAARLNLGSVAPPASAAKPAATPALAPVAAAAVAGIAPVPTQTAAPAPVAAPKSEPARTPASLAARTPLQSQTIAVRSAAKSRYEIAPPHLQRPPLLPKFNYLPLGVVAALILAALLLGPRLLRHRAPVEQAASVEPQSTPSAKPVPAAEHPKSSSKSAPKTPPPSTTPTAQPSQNASQPAAPNSLKRASEKQPLPAPPVNAAPAPVRADASTKSAAGTVTQGEVLNQVMPEVSDKARATIRGTVRVTVKLHIDPAGNVASAELFSPGPSKYFADQALEAAQLWDFSPAKVDGHAVPSEWLVRFEFMPSNTRVHPAQSAP